VGTQQASVSATSRSSHSPTSPNSSGIPCFSLQ
jgi:hypothetical protein